MRLIFLIVSTFVLYGCPKPIICAPPITISCEYKVWPIQRAPAVPGIVLRRLDSPNIIAGVTQEDIDAISATSYQLFTWGSKNERTLEQINELANTTTK